MPSYAYSAEEKTRTSAASNSGTSTGTRVGYIVNSDFFHLMHRCVRIVARLLCLFGLLHISQVALNSGTHCSIGDLPYY